MSVTRPEEGQLREKPLQCRGFGGAPPMCRRHFVFLAMKKKVTHRSELILPQTTSVLKTPLNVITLKRR